MTLSPRQAALILVLANQREGSIRSGLFTGEEALELIKKLKECAEGEE